MVLFRLAHEVSNPSFAAFINFAAQAKPVRLESAGASSLHAPLLALSQVTRRGRKGYELDRQRPADYTSIFWTIL